MVVLGDILRDTLSLQSMPYERAKVHDRALERWCHSLPSDLQLNNLQSIVQGLTLSTPARIRFITLQSIYLRTKMDHIRFVLHQQYATTQICPELLPSIGGDNSKDNLILSSIECLQATIHSASMIVEVFRETIPMCSANLFLALPGHVAWSVCLIHFRDAKKRIADSLHS